MGDPVAIQSRVNAYHRTRFPQCEPHEVMYKAMEELGEVALAMQPPGDPAQAVAEAADVVIVLMALAGRFCGGADLLAAVEAKLSVLTTPGAHRHSLKEARP